MDSKILLTAHIGYRSAIKLITGEGVLECRPGDLHMLSVRNLKLLRRLLDCGAVSHTGQIRRKGHELEDAVITIQNLPALRLQDGTLTSEDVRNIQSAKAKFASSVQALLLKGGVSGSDTEAVIRTIDGMLDLDDAKAIGLVAADMKACIAEFEQDIHGELINLEEPMVLRAYTEHLFFPKR